MIYEDERTVDEMVDDILGNEDDVRAVETPPAEGAQTKPEERVACRRCGKMFARRMGSTRTMCEECFRMSHSRKRPAANDRQISAGHAEPQKKAKPMGFGSGDVQKAWDALQEPETEAKEPAEEKVPEEMTRDELKGALVAGLRKEPGDVILALYETTREVAKAAGIQTRVVIETMYEIDCTLSHIGGM